MNILYVARRKQGGGASPFIEEQAASVRALGHHVDLHFVERGGVRGYVESAAALRGVASTYDIVHGHGLAALCTMAVNDVPVVVTFHGSDVNKYKTRVLSALIASRADHSIYVSERLLGSALYSGKNVSVLPCGVDTALFQPLDKIECRRELGWKHDDKIALFSGSFRVAIKNAPLAREAVLKWGGHLKELRGYDRKEVPVVMNASDALIISSFSEGSPQVVKEALACNVPIVSVDVGDVAEHLAHVSNSVLVEPTPSGLARGLAMVAGERSDGRGYVEAMSMDEVGKKIAGLYKSIAD